jgi:hypothetical protein
MTGDSIPEPRPVLPDIKDSTLQNLAVRCYVEFEDVSDFIWKSPRLLEAETRLEKRKLGHYFPLGDDEEKNARAKLLRSFRWTHENRKLTGVFPYLIAAGNLFSSIALFETYCLILCDEAEKRTGRLVSSTRGSGLNRLFTYMKDVGIDRSGAELREQIDAAIKIRNCVFHASGLLAWSREEVQLRAIVKKQSYLSPFHRKRRAASQDWREEVVIVSGPLGEQLQVANGYNHLLAYYLKTHFVDLCNRAASHLK